MRSARRLAMLTLILLPSSAIQAQEGLTVARVSGPIDVMSSKIRPTGLPLIERAGLGLSTRLRLGYTADHLSISFECEDTELTSSIMEDGADLRGEDVLLARIQVPGLDRRLLVSASPIGRKTIAWQSEDGTLTPLTFEELSSVVVKSAVFGEAAFGTPGTPNQQNIEGLSLSIDVPFSVFGLSTPGSGTEWLADFGRMDWDSGSADVWSWKEGDLGTIVFE